MANKKISQLSATSTANDNVWLVINDSGETTTNKIKRSDLLSGTTSPAGLVNGAGSDSLISSSSLTTTAATASGTNDIAIGNDAIAQGGDSVAIGSSVDSGANSVSIGNNITSLRNNAGGRFNVLIGNNINVPSSGQGSVFVIGEDFTATSDGYQIQIGNGTGNSSGRYATQIGNLTTARAEGGIAMGLRCEHEGRYGIMLMGDGQGSSIGASTNFSSILGGDENNITSTEDYNNIIGSKSSIISGTTSGTTLIGLQNFTSPTEDNTTYVDNLYSVGSRINGTDDNIVLGQSDNTFPSIATDSLIASSIGSSISAANTIGIISSYQSNVTGPSYRSIVAGTYQSNLNAATGCAVLGTYADITGSGNGYDVIAGGISHTLTSSSYSTILGGQNNTITSSNESALISTNGSLISGGSLNSVVLGGRNTTIGDLDEVIMLGTNNRTSLYSATTHAENIHIYGTESKNTITGQTASGATTIDLSTGSVFEFEMTGNITSITFTNWREGGIYEFVVYNNGSHTITSSGVRLDGVANTIAAKAASINPTNNERTLYRMLIVNGKGYLNEHLNFQFM